MLNPFDRMLLLRRGGKVRQFHTEVFVPLRTVAEHTFNVLLTLMTICPYEDLALNLILETLCHDLGEQSGGDLPRPILAHPVGVEAHKAIEGLETDFRRLVIGAQFKLTARQREYLAAAEILEYCFTALELALNGCLDGFAIIQRLTEPNVRLKLVHIPLALELYDLWDDTATAFYQEQSAVLLNIADINAGKHLAAMVGG